MLDSTKSASPGQLGSLLPMKSTSSDPGSTQLSSMRSMSPATFQSLRANSVALELSVSRSSISTLGRRQSGMPLGFMNKAPATNDPVELKKHMDDMLHQVHPPCLPD